MRLHGFARLLLIAAFAVCLVGLIPTAATAQPGGSFELYGGFYLPESDVIDEDLSYGIRAGYRWSERAAFEATLGRFEGDIDFAAVDFEVTLLDLSLAWTVNPGSGAELALFAGPGWAFVDVSSRAFGLSASDDSATVHAGANLRFDLSDSVYLRPDARVRYFEESEEADFEASLAIGFRFGG